MFVTHGDDEVCRKFCDELKEKYSLSAYAPYSGTVYDILADEITYEAAPVPLEKEERKEERTAGQAENRPENTPEKEKDRYRQRNMLSESYQELVKSGSRLMQVITDSAGIANADLRKFAKELDKLADKWRRRG